jgi:hypothetical protein
VPAPKCKVCEAKSETIRALELTIQALNEMVNLQRSIGVTPPSTQAYPPLKAADEAPVDVEDIADRLNNDPDLDPEVADRLLAELQVVKNAEQA